MDKVGDEFTIVEPGLAGFFRFVRQGVKGSVVLVDLVTQEETTVSGGQFSIMRASGSAVRTLHDGVRTATEAIGSFFLLDPDAPGIGKKQRAKRRAARNKNARAMTLHFYATLFDQDDQATKYERKLSRFIAMNFEKAQRHGFQWMPSTSALRKALAFGKPGNRPLGLFLESFGTHTKSRWPDWVDALKQEMIAFYWRPGIQMDAALNFFLAKYQEVRKNSKSPIPKGPAPRTLRDWLKASASKEREAAKHGNRIAHKKWIGTAESLNASRPLEFVVLDQTETDVWFLIKDGFGNVVDKRRAWLVYALDIYSRMVLGFQLTFEPPSVHTLMACIKHTLLPKVELIERFGVHKGATDGYGKALTFIFDNGLENVGISLQYVMQGIGTNIMYASLRTPEHKAHVEFLETRT